MARTPHIDELIQFARFVQTKQPAALDYIKRNRFVFDRTLSSENLDEVGRWQKLAFSLYTDLCELELGVQRMFDEG